MPELFYSDDALNVLSDFYEVEKIVYVEGDDDVVFWDLVFKKLSGMTVRIESVGGSRELNKYIEKIEGDRIDALAARDLDFSPISESSGRCKSILFTYAHSIENSLICGKVISKIIAINARLPGYKVSVDDCESWLQGFKSNFHDLVVYDIANELKETGVSVVGDNCTRFMCSKDSCNVDYEKIKNFISEKLDGVVDLDELDIISSVNESNRSISDFIRGHFLFSAAIKYVNEIIKSHDSKKTTSKDGFFSSAMIAFESVFDESHPHYHHYLSQVEDAAA